MCLPGPIVSLIFEYIPQETWCLDRQTASKIVETRQHWERLSSDLQKVLFLRTFNECPNHEWLFREAARILRKALDLCSVPFRCHALIACHLIEKCMFLDSFYYIRFRSSVTIHSKRSEVRTLDIATYVDRQNELGIYLFCNKKSIWQDRVMDRSNNLYPKYRSLVKYESTSTLENMRQRKRFAK